MAYAILDTFNRADENILASPNYAVLNLTCAVLPDDMWVQSNECGPLNINSINEVYWTTPMATANNQSGLVFKDGDSQIQTIISLWVRVENPGTANFTGYNAYIDFIAPETPTLVNVSIYRQDDCATFVLLGTVQTDLSPDDQVIFYCCEDDFTVAIDGADVLTVTDATYATGNYIAFGVYDDGTRVEDFGGGTVDNCGCVAITSATITADPANSELVCEDQTFTASYLPANATAPITYLWSTDGLQNGQGTATAVYNWVEACDKTVTVTISNACGSASDTETLSLDLTLAQICDAIESTLSSNMTATHLVRSYNYDEIPEGVNDAPSLMVYWQSIVNDAFTQTDRTSFNGVRVKELTFHVDYFANPRNNLAENNALLTGGANEIINILEQEALGCTAKPHCPPFSLCALKNFRWSGERVTFDYGGVTYYGARFIITIRVF